MGLKLKRVLETCVYRGRNLGLLVRQLPLPFAVLLVMLASLLLPALVSRDALAAGQLTERSLSISSGVPSKTGVQYTFTFKVSSTSDIEGMKLQACDSAVGTCNAPAGLSFSSRTYGTQSGWQGATNFAVDATGAGDCTPAVNVICANRTDATTQTSGSSRSIRFDTITNPSTANSTFFVRISLYNANNYPSGAGFVDYGVTASAVVQTLQVNAQVAEVLSFCVGSTSVDDATTSVAGDCSGVSGTSLSLGVLDSSRVNTSPVDTTDGGDDLNGVAMVRTNASNGVVVNYDAVQASSGSNHLGTLRIAGASCNAGSVNTDGCINAQGTTPGTFSNGTEKFGMTVGAVNCGSNGGTNYTCNYSGGSYNLVRDASYDGNGTNTVNDTTSTASTTTNQYAWDETGTSHAIAASSSPNGFVEDEALILKFAAAVALVAPFGSYSVQADFVAVPTY